MNTVLMYVIMCLVCRFKAPGGGRKFEVLEAACLVSINIFIEWVKLQVSKTPPGALNRQTKHIITYINTVFMFLSVFI